MFCQITYGRPRWAQFTEYHKGVEPLINSKQYREGDQEKVQTLSHTDFSVWWRDMEEQRKTHWLFSILKDHKMKKKMSWAPLYSRNWLKQHSQGDIDTHEKQTEHFSHKYMGYWGVEAIVTGKTEPYRQLQVRSSFLGSFFRFLKSVSLRHAGLKKLDGAEGLHNILYANILKSPFNG